jgi:hypothetical protein
MGAHKLEKILEMYGAEKMTPERAIGQMLQHLLEYRGRLEEIERRLRELEEERKTD